MKLASRLPAGRPRQVLAAASYLVLVLGLLAGAAQGVASLYDGYAETTALGERLARLEAGPTSGPRRQVAEAASPFLEGATLTQAGAALQQRIERAAVRAGGALVSSQAQLESRDGQPDVVSLAADVDLPEPELQAFLYDIEAGTPYLFIDAFSARAPDAGAGGKGARIRAALSVSGKWSARP